MKAAATGAFVLVPRILKADTEKTTLPNTTEKTPMAYEWKFNARPYSDEDAKEAARAGG